MRIRVAPSPDAESCTPAMPRAVQTMPHGPIAVSNSAKLKPESPIVKSPHCSVTQVWIAERLATRFLRLKFVPCPDRLSWRYAAASDSAAPGHPKQRRRARGLRPAVRHRALLAAAQWSNRLSPLPARG